jgi:hypothetical protein
VLDWTPSSRSDYRETAVITRVLVAAPAAAGRTSVQAKTNPFA